MSGNTKLLIPKNFRFLGKGQQELYKEAMEKKVQPLVQQKEPKTIITPNSFGNVVPLTDSNDNQLELGAWEAIDMCSNLKIKLSDLKDADAYVLKNGGVFWTGGLIAYSKNKDTQMGKELLYTDDNDDQKYILKTPNGFQDMKGNEALILFFGFFQDKTPYFQRTSSTFKGKPIDEIIINNPDALIRNNLILRVGIPREDGYYLTDSNLLIPNGAESNGKNSDARYFWQVDDGSYLGLLQRDGGDDRQDVSADRGPSGRRRVLVYE